MYHGKFLLIDLEKYLKYNLSRKVSCTHLCVHMQIHIYLEKETVKYTKF